MSRAAIIFNGVHFAQSATARGFAYARQSRGKLLAIFLKTKKDSNTGYRFPGDLKLAENYVGDDQANKDDRTIIESNLRLLEHQARTEQIDFESRILEDPSPEQLKLPLEDVEIIFMEGHDPHGINTVAGVDAKKLLDGLNIPIEIVP